MTHEDAGHYASKHPSGTIDPRIAEAIATKEKDDRVTCAAAHAIATSLSVSPQVVGMNIDLLEKRIHHCQMGLFGHEPETSKQVKPAKKVSEELEQAIKAAMDNDRITCAAAWQVAESMGISKMELASACEALGIKIKKCQLGAF